MTKKVIMPPNLYGNNGKVLEELREKQRKRKQNKKKIICNYSEGVPMPPILYGQRNENKSPEKSKRIQNKSQVIKKIGNMKYVTSN
ncbi:MAG: hypothetical protein K9N00_04115 [Candidatus Marinimicrobia bacterium]|nr:hypothetical protein [Candidatus Neomarinimicrobiota bacterium]